MIVCLVNIILIIQTESDVREEFEEAGIEVESRIFSTDGDPTIVIEDLFVSCQLLYVMYRKYIGVCGPSLLN